MPGSRPTTGARSCSLRFTAFAARSRCWCSWPSLSARGPSSGRGPRTRRRRMCAGSPSTGSPSIGPPSTGSPSTVAPSCALVRIPPAPPSAGAHWVATWGAAPQGPAPGNLSLRGFSDQTLRQIVFTSAGGSMVRVRLTNVFGTRPLTVDRATIAVPGRRREVVSGHRASLTFAGQPSVAIPPGAEVAQRPGVAGRGAPGALAVSIYLPLVHRPRDRALRRPAQVELRGPAAITRSTPAARGFSPRRRRGTSSTGSRRAARRATSARSWPSATRSPPASARQPERATPAGPTSWPGGWTRCPAPTLSVVDEGIGGNRVLNDSPCCGIDAVARFGATSLEQPGRPRRDPARGRQRHRLQPAAERRSTCPTPTSPPPQIIAGYEQIIAAAHAAGVQDLRRHDDSRLRAPATGRPRARPSARRSTAGSAPAAPSTA